MKILLLAGPHLSTNILVRELATIGVLDHVLIEPAVSKKTLLMRRAKRLGWRQVFGQILFQLCLVPFLSFGAKKRIQAIKTEEGFDDSPLDEGLITRIPSVNSQETIALLQSRKPDVVIVHGTRIISKDVLTCLSVPFVNIHAGITPRYRGAHGAYWALAEHRPEACGVTVHEVDAGIDTGRVLAQELIHPLPTDSFVVYPWLQLAAGIRALKRILQTPISQWMSVEPIAGESALWYHPTFWGYLRARLRDGIR